MAATKVYTCDVCGKPRGETNHWFIAYDEIELTFAVWSTRHSDTELLRDQEGAKHICGQLCAMKHLEKFLTRVAA